MRGAYLFLLKQPEVGKKIIIILIGFIFKSDRVLSDIVHLHISKIFKKSSKFRFIPSEP